MKNCFRYSALFFVLIFSASFLHAQQLTSTWEGVAKSKVEGRNTKVEMEVKLIRKGTKILGTTYHYEGPGFHHRYSLTGTFNPQTKEIVFQEEVLILEQSPKFFYVDPKLDRRIYRGKVIMNADSSLSMVLDVILRSDTSKSMIMTLNKNNNPSIFTDEWDYIIEKSADKVSDETIDSIAQVAKPFTQKDYVDGMKKYLKDQKEEKKALAEKEKADKDAAKLAKLDEDKKRKEDEKAKADLAREEKARQDLAKKEEAERIKADMKAREDSVKQARALAKDIAAKEEQLRKELNKARQDSIRKAIALAKEQAAKEDLARKETRAKEEAALKEARAKEEAERKKQLLDEARSKQDAAELAIKKKFEERKKTFVTDVPLAGDSIEIRIFDNGVVDGDSVSLFLNNQMLAKNIGLLSRAYTLKLAVNSLGESSELTMVAENMGTIPPNTAMMIVLSGEERYQVRLESTESTSAMIRFVKKKK